MLFLFKPFFALFFVLIMSEVSASELTEWTFPSDIETDEDRAEYFIDNCERKSRGELSPDVVFHISSNAGAGFGANLVYHGPIEQDAYKIMNDLDNSTRRAVVLGCGNGRNVIDILKKTKNTHVIANDLAKDQLDLLKSAIETLKIAKDRLSIECLDGKKLVEEIPDNSIDYYYVTNLIHFFRFHEIRDLFQHIRRTIRPGGMLFLSWAGYDPCGRYGESLCLEARMEIDYLKNKNVDVGIDPVYIEQAGVSRPSIAQIIDLALGVKMKVLCAEYFYRTAIGGTVLDGKCVLCDYQYELFHTGVDRDTLPICQMICGK